MADPSTLRAKFLRAFANLPQKVRSEDIIAVIDNQPFTWNSAAIEIQNESEVGAKILNVLRKLGVL